jgi:hypothetical protein
LTCFHKEDQSYSETLCWQTYQLSGDFQPVAK